MDAEVAEKLGPFVDCTSNQAIAYFELIKVNPDTSALLHKDLINAAIADARGRLNSLQGSATFEEFVVEISTNPKLAYSTASTIENAKRIVGIFNSLSHVDPKRVCVKIPSTWEGLQACRILEAEGIATLATTMFCMEQAALAAAAGCTYIAPYVNELRVHFEQGYVDGSKGFEFCRQAQAYYARHACRTQVLAASLTSVDEVMQLAGVQHITIAPKLLSELSARRASSWRAPLGAYFAQRPLDSWCETTDCQTILGDESSWRLAFTRSGFGASEGKMIQAINYFSDFQDKIEDLVSAAARLAT
ncbi:Aldolase-type TIM barrel [Metarhizium guizhouense ARSEF 977]|uniref:Transaldolase n=1 Tax=Metarhizium guizhouense (strain ARSEF 977) TaxID=1276136 RepID=A0A0B4GEY4_METGA|nr:Aldolase-type TIM barrel [Metarhizium guizhouense ARSEF 977]